MPRWASRILLEITDVRVQRVQEISEVDAKEEGPPNVLNDTWPTVADWHPVEAFQNLWDSLNARRGFAWADNPWVWSLTFRVLEGPRSTCGEHRPK
jgi:hypothetical protein